jgi:hypothetical protein
MFNSCNTLIAQFRLTRFGFILFAIHMMRVQNLQFDVVHGSRAL